jgi:hypothetical protein
MTYQRTDRPLPAIVIDHPTQNIHELAIVARATQIANAAQRLLCGDSPQ